MPVHAYLLKKGWAYRGCEEDCYEKEIDGILEIMDERSAYDFEQRSGE